MKRRTQETLDEMMAREAREIEAREAENERIAEAIVTVSRDDAGNLIGVFDGNQYCGDGSSELVNVLNELLTRIAQLEQDR